jgi:hypothetical protein
LGKQKTYQIPFDDDGNLMSYPSKKYPRDENGNVRTWVPNMRDNYEFEATLTYAGFDNGIRSAHRVIWQDEAGRTYPMFISRLGEALETHGMDGNTMTGRWTFMKQGQNYSIRAVKPDKPKKRKRKKATKKTDGFVSGSAFDSMREERDALLAKVATWNRVCAEVIAAPIYRHVFDRVEQESKGDKS